MGLVIRFSVVLCCLSLTSGALWLQGCASSVVDPSSQWSDARNDSLIQGWRVSRGGFVDKASNYYSVVCVDSRMFCADRDSIRCLDTNSGRRVWVVPWPFQNIGNNPPEIMLTEDGGLLVIGSKVTCKYDATNGQLLWSLVPGTNAGFLYFNVLRSVWKNRLYLLQRTHLVEFMDVHRVLCVDIGSGSEVWNTPISHRIKELDPEYIAQGAAIFSLSASPSGVYVGINENSRRIEGNVKTCSLNKLNYLSGEIQWRCLVPGLDSTVLNVPSGARQTEIPIFGPVAECEDGGVIGVAGSCITKWDQNGRIDYRYFILHEGDWGVGEGFRHSTYRDGVFYNTDNGYSHAFAYAFDTRTRSMQWIRSLNSSGPESISASFPNLLTERYFDVVTDNGWLFRLNRTTGIVEHQSSLWQLPRRSTTESESLISDVAVRGNSIYFSTDKAWYKGMIP